MDEDYKEKYLRALADYQNLEKQTQNWKESYSVYAALGVIQKLLEVLDDLEKAQDHLKDEGLQLVINKLKSVLTSEDVEELDLEGKEFNPSEAEVIGTEPGEKDNTIIKMSQKGYKIKNKIIRPAKVIVSVK